MKNNLFEKLREKKTVMKLSMTALLSAAAIYGGTAMLNVSAMKRSDQVVETVDGDAPTAREDQMVLSGAKEDDVYIQDGIHCKSCEDGTYMVVRLDDGIEKISIPGIINGKVVSRIHSMRSDSLKEVQIPDTVTDIDEEAFKGCRFLDKVALPKNLREIKEGVFFNCFRLRQVTLPEGLKTISSHAFKSCNLLRALTIPASVDNISEDAFEYCHLLQAVSKDDTKFRVTENGSLRDVKNDRVVIKIDKNFIKEKEAQADLVYNKFQELKRDCGDSLESFESNINAFMQVHGGGKPQVLSKDAFKKHISKEKRFFRGVGGLRYCDALRCSDVAYFSNAFNGHAIYTTDDFLKAKRYAEDYAPEEDPYIMMMALADDANITTDLELDTIKNIIVSDHYDEFPESKTIWFGDFPNNINKQFINDYGLIAAILGFDAIDNLNDIEFDWIGREMAVVNRSKLIICDKDIAVGSEEDSSVEDAHIA